MMAAKLDCTIGASQKEVAISQQAAANRDNSQMWKAFAFHCAMFIIWIAVRNFWLCPAFALLCAMGIAVAKCYNSLWFFWLSSDICPGINFAHDLAYPNVH